MSSKKSDTFVRTKSAGLRWNGPRAIPLRSSQSRRPVSGEQVRNELSIARSRHERRRTPCAFECCEVLEIAGVRNLVEIHYLSAVLNGVVDEVRADEPSAAGHQERGVARQDPTRDASVSSESRARSPDASLSAIMLRFLASPSTKSTSGVDSATMNIWYEKSVRETRMRARFARIAAWPSMPPPRTFGNGAGTPRTSLIRKPASYQEALDRSKREEAPVSTIENAGLAVVELPKKQHDALRRERDVGGRQHQSSRRPIDARPQAIEKHLRLAQVLNHIQQQQDA